MSAPFYWVNSVFAASYALSIIRVADMTTTNGQSTSATPQATLVRKRAPLRATTPRSQLGHRIKREKGLTSGGNQLEFRSNAYSFFALFTSRHLDLRRICCRRLFAKHFNGASMLTLVQAWERRPCIRRADVEQMMKSRNLYVLWAQRTSKLEMCAVWVSLVESTGLTHA